MHRRIGDLLARAAAGIGCAALFQALQRFFISRCPLTLVKDGFVAVQAERFQRAQDVICSAEHAARYVEILHAHQPCTAVMFCVKVAADRCDEGTEMEWAGGARGETPPIFS